MSQYCSGCEGPLEKLELKCPGCGQLVHAGELERLGTEARALEASGDFAGSMECWRRTLVLLPPDSPETATIKDYLEVLNFRRAKAEGSHEEEAKKASWMKRFGGPFVVIGGLLWKFKTIALLIFTKAKFLLFGLAKLKTVASMFLFFGVYWAQFGWPFALGFALSIYVHEMGHMWMLRQYGLRASAPLFIPFVGAFVALYDSPADVHQDARIGLAGPTWGLGAGIFCGLMAILTGERIWAPLAHTVGFMNLFNLLPVIFLDGGRGARALDQQQRWAALGLSLALAWMLGQFFLLLIAVGFGYRLYKKDAAPAADWPAFWQFGGLLVTLGLLSVTSP